MGTAVFSLGMTIAFAALGLSACNGNTSERRTGSDRRAPAVSADSFTVRPTVAWPATSSIDDGALLSLTKSSDRTDSELRALVARSPVPVLAPKDLRLATATLMVEGEYFALAGHVDELGSRATISIQGTRAAHRYEGIDPKAGDRALRASGAVRGFVSVNEGIRTASWIENGGAYSVDVECSDVHDARCQTEGFLLSIVAQLTYVGGSGR